MERNEAQERAIETIDGPVLLISCPGSGKTTTMLRRIAHMIDAGIDPKNILMVTFTTASAADMRARFEKDYEKSEITFCTIHSLCYKILKSFSGNVSVMNEMDKYAILNNALKGIRLSAYTTKSDVLSDISAFKNKFSDMEHFKPTFLTIQDFKKVYAIYEKLKFDSGFLDFDDILIKCRELLKNNSSVLSKVRERYKYIICDEYQDTNPVQKDILYMITGPEGNICVVGDDDQSIYGFRGADPSIMFDFEKDFKKCLKINMVINYRSAPEIIETAKNLIENNKNRFKKDIMAFRRENGSVIYDFPDLRENELASICNKIKEMFKSGIEPDKIAILGRTNMQLEDIMAKFEDENIPYTTGENVPDIYESFIFDELMSYLKIINGKRCSSDVIKIINKPFRGILLPGFFNIEDMTDYDILSLSRYCDHPHLKDSMKIFVSDLGTCKNKTLAEQIRYIVYDMKYGKYLSLYAQKAGLSDSVLMDKLNFFIKESARFKSVNGWRYYANHHISEHKDRVKHRDAGAVTISTMHKSKGCEWDNVFIIDCCKGVIPSSKSTEIDEIEEERRLFYVAATRAKKNLFICGYSNKISSTGKKVDVEKSIFINECTGKSKRINELKRNKEEARKKEVQNICSEFEDINIFDAEPGMLIYHKKYGQGTVVQKTSSFITVRFQAGTKIFPLI